MMISEQDKANYDVIAQNKHGRVIVIHNNTNNTDIKPVYESVYEFKSDMQQKGLRNQVFEAING